MNEAVHKHTIRHFLGFNKCATILCLQNKLIDIVGNRQAKQIFKWHIQKNKPWLKDMYNRCCNLKKSCRKLIGSVREKV